MDNLRKYIELTVRLRSAGEVGYLRLPCFREAVFSSFGETRNTALH